MPIKPKTAKRPATKQTCRTSTIFDKYGTILKVFANYGAAGLFGGYILTVTLPNAQTAFMSALERQNEQNREDRKNGWEHGDRAVTKIATSIDGLRDTFQANQKAGHDNQKTSIAVQEKMAELLESQVKATKSQSIFPVRIGKEETKPQPAE